MNEPVADAETLVRTVVVRHPRTRNVLEELGVDYCCGGNRRLKEAADEAGVDVTDLIDRLNQAARKPPTPGLEEDRDWADALPAELIDHIVDTHHAFLKQHLPELERMQVKVMSAHGKNHADTLEPLRQQFDATRAELETHLAKEETAVFPCIRSLSDDGSQCSGLPGGSLADAIDELKAEHEDTGRALARMRRITDDYTLPGDACPSYAAMYQMFQDLQDDIHEHIHLENNILFPEAEERS